MSAPAITMGGFVKKEGYKKRSTIRIFIDWVIRCLSYYLCKQLNGSPELA